MIYRFVESIKHNYEFKIRSVEQTEQKGTSDALLAVKDEVKDRFLLMMGDNIYCHEDVKGCAEKKNSILVKEVKNPELFGVVIQNNDILVYHSDNLLYHKIFLYHPKENQ